MPPPQSLLRKAFADIGRGYSTVSRGRQVLYVKHLSSSDQTEVDDYYEVELARARKKGIPSEEAKRKWLDEKGLWTKKDDRDLAMHSDYVTNLELTKTKAWIKSQIEAQEAALIPERKTLAAMVAKRDSLIGLTDEKCASQKMQFYYIHLSFYLDKGMACPLHSMAEMNDLDEDDSYELLNLYIAFVNRFDAKVIRSLSVSPLFTNSFYLCGENLSQFFGKPIMDLTFYQSNLLSYASYFKSLMSQEAIPPMKREDPDQIEEYVNMTAAAKASLKTSLEGGSTGVVGATSADFAAMGLTEDKKGLHMQKREG